MVNRYFFFKAAASLGFCLKRRISVHRRLQRITKSHHIIGKSDVPKVCWINVAYKLWNISNSYNFFCQSVYRHIQQEYARACLVRYESLPKNESQEGWAPPGELFSPLFTFSSHIQLISGISLSGSKDSEMRFRTLLLRTVRDIGMFFRTGQYDTFS